MTEPGCVNDKMATEVAADKLVREVMVRRPKTIPPDSTVAQLRAHLENPHVQMALLADGPRFAGAIPREALPESAAGDEPARAYARTDVPIVSPDASMSEAMETMERHGDHRLVVLDGDGETLAGLLCLDRAGASFCVEAPAAQAP